MSKTLVARVLSHRRVADTVVEVELVGERDALPTWEAGAHTDVHLPNGLVRQYSLLRSPLGEHVWRLAVLIEPESRGGSRYLGEKLAVGMLISVGEPRNHFLLDDSPFYCFIAGGIGVTPLLGMIDVAEARGADWTLHYLGRTRSHLAYVDELLARYGDDRVQLHLADEGTRIDLDATVGSLNEHAQIYTCGPERLLEALEARLGESEILHLERFTPKQQTFLPNRSFTVVAARSGVEFTVPADESILVAADFEGIETDGDCLEGTCGSCETRIIEGTVEHRDSVLTPRQQREGSCMMICVSRSLGERLVLDM